MARHIVVGIALAAVLGMSGAMGAENGERRGSAPPGTSQDGSRPDEGAIKGGSIDGTKGADKARERSREVERCRDLEGTLREQCVADARKRERSDPRQERGAP
jgi:hypothetical protein